MNLMVRAVDILLSPISGLKPHLVVLIVAISTTILYAFVRRMLFGRKKMSELKERIAKIREKINLAQKIEDEKEMERWLKELLKMNREYFKVFGVSIVFSLLLFIFFLPWFSAKFGSRAVAVLPINIYPLGNSLNWVIWYILVSLMTAWIMEKLLG